jgi:hypothetical protein
MILEENVDAVLHTFNVDTSLTEQIRRALLNLDDYARSRNLPTFLVDGVLNENYIGCYDSTESTNVKRGAFLFGFDVRDSSLRFVFPDWIQMPAIPVRPWEDKPELRRAYLDLNALHSMYIQSVIENVGRQLIERHQWR